MFWFWCLYQFLSGRLDSPAARAALGCHGRLGTTARKAVEEVRCFCELESRFETASSMYVLYCLGTRLRTRPACCDTTLTFEECMASCGMDRADARHYEACAQTCDHGVFSGSSCQCDVGYYGSCCQYS